MRILLAEDDFATRKFMADFKWAAVANPIGPAPMIATGYFGSQHPVLGVQQDEFVKIGNSIVIPHFLSII